MGQYWLVLGGTGSVQGGNGWYLRGTGTVWGGTGSVKFFYACMYILKKAEIWSGVTDSSQTHTHKQKIVPLSLSKV